MMVFHGGEGGVHRGIFVSTDREFASDYGDVTAYDLSLDGASVFDSLDEEQVGALLPITDPYDGVDITTFAEYLDRSSDTWEMIESYVSGYGIVVIYEGDVKNYKVNDIRHLRPLDPALVDGGVPLGS
ncbi:hypothetical protein G6L37_05430 [Agrobacterium rubi]|nr:hypothetical protein [Agrobacterium rubi]NTF24799.1 hypothetical protein [Agrobacterium rubi]